MLRSLITTLLVALVVSVALPAGAAPPPGTAPPGETHTVDHGPGEFNLFHGVLGEKEGLAEGNLLFRPKGTPPPFGAWLVNFAILAYFVGRFSARPVGDALKKRKAGIMHGIEEASRMKEDAADRLAGYEDKLQHVDDEIERVKREMQEAGEAERVRILQEAHEKRERMERDTRLLIEQELKAAREILLRETIAGAVRSASVTLEKQLTPADHDRLAKEYLEALDRIQITTRGGSA
jgi:F-type H+-transporting ATPase subunit b